ncbi:hypothetical protein NAT51_14925 [Flavobacterium amniphilum]|uniref:hypothetical protein n=1 Tax=Flavobacterium amniphilum TaxID=1834035 RepID=UPI002029C3F5|nr:hypothetical protein [Flavobacterium amniphilum]MCL9806826.1 hypothetical protein [Flavobacterium amniphilum]
MKKLQLFLLVFIAFGCRKEKSLDDVFSTAKIVNSTKQEIIISIQYDKQAIEKRYGRNSYRLGTLSIENTSQTSFDSDSLISKVRLIPKDSLMIEYTKAKSPKFEDLKKIVIHSPKTLILNNKKEMINSFTEKDKQLFILEIK